MRTSYAKNITSLAIANSFRKRVFLLGPSHHWGLPGAATTACSEYGTPIGNLIVDTELVETIRKKWSLKTMSTKQDEDEHSLEMHLPYIYKMLSLYALRSFQNVQCNTNTVL